MSRGWWWLYQALLLLLATFLFLVLFQYGASDFVTHARAEVTALGAWIAGDGADSAPAD